MSKKNLIFYSSILLIGYIFLPVVFMNIPLPGTWFSILAFYVVSLIIVKPELLISKQLFIIYLFSLIYFLMSPLNEDPYEKEWFQRRVVSLFVGVSLYTYYFKYFKNVEKLRIIFWFAIISVFISCVTTSIGLVKYPLASRQLAGSAGGDIELVKYYSRIGIAGYGFMTALAYVVPLVIFYYKKFDLKKWKSIALIYGLVILYTVFKSQYTAQFILVLAAFALSLFSLKFSKHKVLILAVLLIVSLIPSGIYANLINEVALFSGDILSQRLFDLALTIENESISTTDGHLGMRYQRIPFLLSEFFNNPIFGGGHSTGHVFWLDHLSLYGIIGMIPWFFLLFDNYTGAKKMLRTSFIYYQIAFILFIILGFMKGSGHREQYIILFFILPLGLWLFENGLLFKKRNLTLNH